jgi:hypothetical protein
MDNEFNYLDIVNNAKIHSVSSIANDCQPENVLSLEKQVKSRNK